jgi:multidrug transporter EmrE-like cation transporter
LIQNWLIGIFWGIVAQIATFYQLQGPLKYQWMRENNWILWLCGIPISYFYMSSVKNLVIAFNGELWPSRIIGFVIGVFVFSVLSIVLFDEPLKPKTIVCLVLAGLILMIQLFWK